MSAVPGVSRFWSAEGADGGKLLTWENFFLNRDTNTPVSAQLELRPSGDYIARSNLVERLYRRVNPDDWDDDGIPNDDDLDPYFYDGDNFGPHQELPRQGATPSSSQTKLTSVEAYWHHTTNRGAGVWYRPSASNFFFEDVPSFDLYCPPPFTGGTITWVIPIGWGENDANSLEDIAGTMSTLYNQVYTLDRDGGLQIDKFGQWIKMDVSGGITHSPGIVEQ